MHQGCPHYTGLILRLIGARVIPAIGATATATLAAIEHNFTVAESMIWVDQKKIHINAPWSQCAWGYRYGPNTNVVIYPRMTGKFKRWTVYYGTMLLSTS